VDSVSALIMPFVVFLLLFKPKRDFLLDIETCVTTFFYITFSEKSLISLILELIHRAVN
jgi:hypothetical protein